MYRKRFAYCVVVGGQKRFGGVVTADTMEDAVRRVIPQCKIEVRHKESVLRYSDGAVVPQADFLLDGKKAHIGIWADPCDH